ncbi:hypothetical protein HDV01_005169 [Terramyces sp. JEL0728]|nr:hypothetical protein HDV01_005169 [Terramyces sp. JEL0728]
MADDGKKDTSGRGPMTIIGDAILAETIRKELRNFKINENYMLSPNAIKNLVLTNKPTDKLILTNMEMPEALKKELKASHSLHDTPRTTSEIYGWDTKPLMRITDRRFYHPKAVTEITKMYGTHSKPKDAAQPAKAK